MTLYEKVTWTIDQLREYCTVHGERRTILTTTQQREGAAIKRIDMSLCFNAISASEDAVRLYGRTGEFTIDKPQSITAANTGTYMWLCIENASGEAFVLLLYGDERNSSIDIASEINSVKIELTDAEKGYSLIKSFTHLTIGEDTVLLHDTQARNNNYISFEGVHNIQLENDTLRFTDGSGELFELLIDADTQPTLETLTRRCEPLEGKIIIPGADSLRDRCTALQKLKNWIFNKKQFIAFIDTDNQPYNSPFAFHEWHLRLHYSDLKENDGRLIFKTELSNDCILEIEIAAFSLAKAGETATLRITDTSSKSYAIEYRKVK